MNQKQEAGERNTKVELAKKYIELHELQMEAREKNINTERKRSAEGVRLGKKIYNAKIKIKTLELQTNGLR